VFGGGPVIGGTQSFSSHGKSGGWQRIQTSTTANSAYQALWANMGIYTTTTPAWYFAGRMTIFTAVDTAAVAAFGIQDSGNSCSIHAGWVRNLHATNFVVQYDGYSPTGGSGTGLNLGVAVDTDPHIYEMWCLAGSNELYARIDGGTTVHATMSSPPSSKVMVPGAYVINGATAANRGMDIDWALCVAQRT
jgi:hypothetical protein